MPQHQDLPVYRVLSLDGGGMRGLYSTALLELLVADYPQLLRNVDLIAGTSTGAIVALGLAKGLSPSRMVHLYRKEGERIFDDSFWDDVFDLGSAVGADYDHDGLKAALEKFLGPSTQLQHLKKRVLVPAFDLDRPKRKGHPRAWNAKFFHNFPGADSDGDELVVDVAIRSCSAPTYFPSYQGFIDGGVVANNPSMAAIAQALSSKGGKQPSPSSIALLSIGTGEEPLRIEGDVDWGWGQWAEQLISLMISGGMGVVHYQCQQLLGERYRRLNTVLPNPIALDDTTEDSLNALQAHADATFNDVRDDVVQWLEEVQW